MKSFGECPSYMMFRIFNILLFSLILQACATPSPSFIFNHSDHIYYLNGDLQSSSYLDLIKILNENSGKPVTVIANSNGGKVMRIEDAMDAMRAHGQVYWKVKRGGRCYSACALLGLSATKIDGTLHFHSVFSSFKDTTYKFSARNISIRSRLISYGYDESFVNRLFDSIYIYTKLRFVDGKLDEVQ
jgi:hypothetical protein